MGLSQKEMFLLFPSGFFTGKLPDIALCDRIEKKLRDMQTSGHGSVSNGHMRAFTTSDNLQSLPEMKELVALIMEESEQILDAYKVKRASHYISNMWANIASPNRRHLAHAHPNCLLSGLVYIRTPQGCGNTLCYLPRAFSNAIIPELLEKNELNADTFKYPVEKGRMVIWQSHMPHAVDEGIASEDEDRIVIAFNIMIRGWINLPTAKLKLA